MKGHRAGCVQPETLLIRPLFRLVNTRCGKDEKSLPAQVGRTEDWVAVVADLGCFTKTQEASDRFWRSPLISF